MSLTKKDLQAITSVVQKEVTKLESKLDKRFEQIDSRFEQIDARFEKMDSRIDNLDEKISYVYSSLSDKIDSVHKELLGHIDGLAVVMTANLREFDKRIDQNAREIHGVKDFLKI